MTACAVAWPAGTLNEGPLSQPYQRTADAIVAAASAPAAVTVVVAAVAAVVVAVTRETRLTRTQKRKLAAHLRQDVAAVPAAAVVAAAAVRVRLPGAAAAAKSGKVRLEPHPLQCKAQCLAAAPWDLCWVACSPAWRQSVERQLLPCRQAGAEASQACPHGPAVAEQQLKRLILRKIGRLQEV